MRRITKGKRKISGSISTTLGKKDVATVEVKPIAYEVKVTTQDNILENLPIERDQYFGTFSTRDQKHSFFEDSKYTADGK